MKKYKVLALALGGSNNKIYKSGDVVSERNFPLGNADILVTKGFLKEITEESSVTLTADEEVLKVKADKKTAKAKRVAEQAAAAKKEGTDDEPQTEGTDAETQAEGTDDGLSTTEGADADKVPSAEKSFFNAKGEKIIVYSIDDITKNELIKELAEANMVFDSASKKPALYDLWLNK